MLGTLNTQKKEVVIVGGGIAGLLAAWHLDRIGWQVALFEKNDRCGGLIQTRHTELGMAEWAAHSILATPAVETICNELGVTLVPVNDESRARYIYRDGKMRRMPLRITELAGAALKAFSRKAPSAGQFKTVEDWCQHHLGQSACDYMLTPFLFGIYGAGPSEISLEAALPSMQLKPGQTLGPAMLARRCASKKRPKAAMKVPEKGMQSITDALACQLQERLGDRFQTGHDVTTLPDTPNTMLCVPAYAAAPLLESVDASLSSALAGLPYAPLISCTVFVRAEQFKRRPSGVGVLVPARENRACLGILFPSASFPGRTRSEEMMSFTVMLGGTRNPAIVEQSESDIRQLVTEEMQIILGLEGPVEKMDIFYHPHAIPLYSPGILDLWKTAEKGWCQTPGHILFGNYSGQVSVRGMMETCCNRLCSDAD